MSESEPMFNRLVKLQMHHGMPCIFCGKYQYLIGERCVGHTTGYKFGLFDETLVNLVFSGQITEEEAMAAVMVTRHIPNRMRSYDDWMRRVKQYRDELATRMIDDEVGGHDEL